MSQLEDDKKLMKRIDEHAQGLSEWEVDFVASCLDRLEHERELTEKQRSIAHRIDEKKIP